MLFDEVSTGRQLANLSLNGSGRKSSPSRERYSRRRSDSGERNLDDGVTMQGGHRYPSSEGASQGACSVQCTAEHSAGTALLGLFPEVLIMTMQYLEPKEAHRVLVGPVCRVFYQEACSSVVVWRALCSGAPWHVPLSHLDDVCMCDAHIHLGHPRCHQPACAARALRRKHHMLLSQVELINRQSGSRESKVSELCEIMNAWPAVIGIQLECLKAVVPLLEAERVRKVAQDSALAHQVVSGLRNFESHLELQQFALHSLVLLARPIGGREGAVHIGMAPALPALQGPRGGICTVLTVMDRHLHVPGIQAMACWSLVNFALSSTCKTLLVEKKGVDRVLRAMETHPLELQVQFRGLFALINLVVPDTPGQQPDNLEVIIERVLAAMQTFMHQPMLVNRGCLVLQNLSLNELNYSQLKRSSAKELLLQALVKHGVSDSMLKQSARATMMRLYGEDDLSEINRNNLMDANGGGGGGGSGAASWGGGGGGGGGQTAIGTPL